MTGAIREIWRTHDEINLFLLESMADGGFEAVTLLKTGKPSTGRTVSRVFAHMHAVRVSRIGRALVAGVPRFEDGASPGRAELLGAFHASGRAVEERLAELTESGERAKHRPGLMLLGYLISHESHHRGQIILAWKQSGVKMPDEVRFGIWEHWWKPKLKMAGI